MAIDAPAYTLWMQKIEVIGPTPVPEAATTETPISKLADITTALTTYSTILSYTVPASTAFICYGIEFYASAFTKARYRLTIGGVEQWADKELPTAFNLHFAEARMPTATVILLEGKSSDGTQVQLWGSSEGKEVA